MVTVSPRQFLLLYIWFVLVILIIFTAMIARFYQRETGQPTYYKAYLLPATLFGIGIIHQAHNDTLMGDNLSNAVYFSGGVTLLLLCIHLYIRMLRR